MNRLLEVMNNYWETHEATEYYEGDGPYKWFPANYDDKQYEELMTLLWDNLFIGSCWNLDTRRMLQENGYRCWIGDGDSFGILIACITKNGKSLSIG